MDHAVSQLAIPRVRTVRGIPSFKGFLHLGDPERYSTALRIPVERYYRTYAARPPSASSFVLRSDAAGGSGNTEPSAAAKGQQDGQGGDGDSLTKVRSIRTYQVKDESAPGGKADVERENLAKGYEYGRTAVHISETDENITRLETYAAMDLVGFIQNDKVRLAHNPVYHPYASLKLTCVHLTVRSLPAHVQYECHHSAAHK